MLHLHSSVYRIFIFLVGIIATIAYRLLIILNHYSQFWVEIFWYIGTVGFIWYFAHRFNVENKRDKLIDRLNLVEKIQTGRPFNVEDKAALLYVLKSLGTSLARWNYIAIFFFSFLAMAYAFYVDLSAGLK